ncbi:MAG: hypothetical protein LC732_01190 [Acidobacteria bacterium]|nr:hypothetical protein [Acidobacteriota bacterium]
MAFTRLPESVQTLYAELLDQMRVADAEAAVGGAPGTFVSKKIRGRVYWYVQRSEGAAKSQIYIGPETPELLRTMDGLARQREARTGDETLRRELVSMLAAGGAFRESAAIGTVLRILAEASVFRAGGVLVGTQAFTCIANMLGVAFQKESLRTADVDVAYDRSIPLGLGRVEEGDLLEQLRAGNPAFFAVPGIDARRPSTSFSVRRADLRVDFLTPAPRGSSSEPIFLPHLGVAAQPLPGLDFVLEGAVDAAAVVGSGIRVNVPSPARFAIHKLWLTTERPVSEAAKARKDLRQAEQLFEVLLEDRPGDLEAAWSSLPPHGRIRRGARKAKARLDEDLNAKLTDLLRW